MVNWIKSIQGIIMTGATILIGIGIGIRDHITVWNNKKNISEFTRITKDIQKQIGRHKDEIFNEMKNISNQTSEVKGALGAILTWMEKNGRN